jgi:hypothetical protein
MKVRIALALLAICMISGCHGYGHLYPVEGPLASLPQPPIYTFSYTYPASPKNDCDQNGTFSMVLPNGETFQGPWKMIYQKAATPSAAVAAPESTSMAAAWDTVYGQSFYNAHVLGTPYFAHTVMTGSQGTILQVEWYVHEVSGATIIGTRGIAKDSKGNIYKLVF